MLYVYFEYCGIALTDKWENQLLKCLNVLHTGAMLGKAMVNR